MFGGPLALTPGPCSSQVGGLISGPGNRSIACEGPKKRRSGRAGRRINFRNPKTQHTVRGAEKKEVRESGSADSFPEPENAAYRAGGRKMEEYEQFSREIQKDISAFLARVRLPEKGGKAAGAENEQF